MTSTDSKPMTLADLQELLNAQLPGWKISRNTNLLLNSSGSVTIVNGNNQMKVIVRDGSIVDYEQI